MAWWIKGTYFESCNCDPICPCVAGLGLPSDGDRCEFAFAMRIESGEIDGTDVGGLNVAFVGDAPPLMETWRLGFFLDERATAEQRQALEALCTGRLGGPPAFAEEVSERLGVETASVEIEEEGPIHRLRVSEAVDLEVEDAEAGDGSGGVRRLTGLAHFMSPTLAIAQARRSKVAAFGLEFDTSGRNAHSAPFRWQS